MGKLIEVVNKQIATLKRERADTAQSMNPPWPIRWNVGVNLIGGYLPRCDNHVLDAIQSIIRHIHGASIRRSLEKDCLSTGIISNSRSARVDFVDDTPCKYSSRKYQARDSRKGEA